MVVGVQFGIDGASRWRKMAAAEFQARVSRHPQNSPLPGVESVNVLSC